MKQNLLLVAVLATLSMANAAPLHKRATTFAACSSGSPTALTTSIQPDPPVAGQTLSVTIAGTTTSDLATGSQLVFQILDGAGTAQGDSAKLDFCTSPGVTCPVATGTAFSTTATITMPATLPETYSLVAEVTDATGAVVGCSTGTPAPDGGAPPPPPDGGDAPPPPDGGDAPPDGGDAPPDGGDAPPDGGDAPPDGGDAPPDGGDAPPDGGDAPPDGGDGQ